MRIVIALLFFVSLFCEEMQKSSEKAIDEQMVQVNIKLQTLRQNLKAKYDFVNDLYKKKSPNEEFSKLLKEINQIKQMISQIEQGTRQDFVNSASKEEEPFAFWDQGETTLSQLIMEYGACDYLYVIPYEISSMKINMYSTVPIPRQSWQEMIELILTQNGIGVKKLTPYLRELYILKHDLTSVEAIASKVQDLELIPDNANIFYVFSPQPEQVRNVQNFFERFSDPKLTTIQTVGCKIVIVATKESVEKLVKLYSAAWDKEQTKVVRVISSSKLNAQELEKILRAFFQDSSKARPSFYPPSADELVFLPLPQGSLAMVGEERSVNRAEEMIKDIEKQLEDPSEMCVYWYPCKHSDPEDLAAILDKVYLSLVETSSQDAKQDQCLQPTAETKPKEKRYDPGGPCFEKSSAYKPVLPVTPVIVQPGRIDSSAPKQYHNFIVDNKTGTLLMVVRRDSLTKIKSLLKKMDVPKKMVQLDVLLVEKKLTDRKQTGINILKIGSAPGERKTAISFDTNENAKKKGILEFFMRRAKGKFPAFDFAFNFLMAQEDVNINANPSVMAINNTPATISIVEELSINNGAIQLDTPNGISVEKSYTRAQFGITIVLTPTIHLQTEEEENEKGFVTLKTDVNFDTTKMSLDDRPPVTRRHIENEVRIADGETVILGGLRRQTSEDTREKIPFLGDLPGIGKLFGTTKLADHSNEMFIFITPKIIKDPIEDLKKIRQEEVSKRAGDLPEFYQRIEESKKEERRKLFHKSLQLIFE